MRGRQILFFSLFVIVFLTLTGIPTEPQYYEIKADPDPDLIAGRNVNMVSGTVLPDGDPYLQRQNEPSIAVSTRNPLHLLAGANDYRTVDMPFSEGELPGADDVIAAGDAWLGVFKSFDGGESWISTLLPGFPQDQSPEGLGSPFKNGEDPYPTAADPVVRAGTNGLFFYSGIVFNREEPKNSAVFMARFIDNNNDEEEDPIQHIDTKIIDSLNGGRFKDKPWIAVDIPKNNAKTTEIAGQNIPMSNVYIVYSVFKEVGGIQQSEIHFCRSTDCGNTWEEPIILSSGHLLNQGATIAVDPRGNGHVYVAWRRFDPDDGQTAQTDAIVIARSTNGGKKFPEIIEVTDVPGPFDQPTSSVGNPLPGTAFRTNSYPTMAIDDRGRIYIAWAQRGIDPVYPFDSRVVIATSKDGFVWTTPLAVESSIPGAGNSGCHEFMPSIAFAGGRLILAWYDTRNDSCSDPASEWIYDSELPGTTRHTVDVRVAQGQPGEFPIFQPSVQVSRYLWAMWESSPGNYYFSQVQFNPPNYPLFKGGTVPFHGDYIEIAPSPALVQSSKGVWRFNTEPTDSQQFHLAWTDNRDVRPPENNNWEIYNPPSSSQSLSQSQFFVKNGCDPQNTGMRNQNIYTSCITSVFEAGAPGNNKPLGTLGTNPTTGELIPRAFVIFVKNPTEDIRHYRLQITDGPDHGTASFLEFDILDEIDVSIAPYSSISRPLFVTSSDENDTVTVDVFEIDEPGGFPVDGGARSTIVINPDETNPDVTGDLATTETHNPDIASPNIVNWTYVNPNIVNPNIVNPNIVNPNIVNPNIVNPNIVNPNIVNPNIVNPNIVNPNIVNPNIVNPNIVNPNIVNSSIADADVTDIEWAVTNAGNTISSYTFKIFARESLPRGIYAQLLVYKVHYTPATDGSSCDLQQTPHHELLLNIVNPNIVNPNIVNPNIVNPNIVNAAIENATFFLSPGDEAKAVLRLIDPDPGVTKFLQSGRKFKIQSFAESLGAATGSQAVDSEDALQGDTTAEADSTELIITTSSLPDGTVGEPYPTIQLEAAGGDETYVWSANSELLPPGIGFTNDGVISGIPQDDPNVTYPHIYSFLVQVSSGGEVDTQNLSITINSAEEPTPPLNIETTTLPPGTVGNYYGYTLQATGGTPPRNWSKASGTLPLGLNLDSVGVISGTIQNDSNVSQYPHTYSFVVKVTGLKGSTDTQPLSITVSDIVYPDLTISGTITGQGGAPILGVAIYGLPHAPQTDSYGFFSDTVPYGWSGTITPFKAGYTFSVSAVDPSPNRTYSQITEDRYSQDFIANTINYTISGTITFYGSPLAGVTMNGLPGTPITNASGYYSASVPHGWSGTVIPELLDYIFDPLSRTYTSLTSDRVNQYYTATFVGVGTDDPFEDNDNLNGATDLTPGTYENMQLHDDDWYRVNVAQGSDLKVVVNGDLNKNIDLEIYDGLGNRIIGAYGSPQNATAYVSDLPVGWCYFRVVYLGTTGFWNSYDLTIETGSGLGNGGITGRVSNSLDEELENIEITLFDTQSDNYFATTTNANGDYKISLPPSMYKLFFDASAIGPTNYVSEYYDNQLTFENADEIDVQAYMSIIGIDAVLELESVLTIVTTSLPDGNLATGYNTQLEATGGQIPYTWELADGSGPLPDGLVLQSSGLIEGTPTTLGTFLFTVELTDSSPTSVTQALSITINTYAGTEFVISGIVTPALAGVVMSGLPGNPVTNSSGEYTAYVYSGWSGTVTPILAGYAFDPASRPYSNVDTSQTSENYTASTGFAISGEVTLGGAPLEGVLMSGLPTNPYTDENGQYSGSVPSNWSGTVTPILPGFSFNPASNPYSNVGDDVPNQNYTANYTGGEDDIYDTSPENNDDYASAAEVTLGTYMNLVLNDEDWFKVYIPAGNENKDLKINIKAHSYPEPNGYEDLDFIVVDQSEKMLGYVPSSSDDETLYISDVAEGWYYIGQTYISQIGTVYSLTLEVSDNFGIGYISGRITDETTGQPIEGIYVELYGQPFDWANSRPFITTDANGEYKVGYLPGDFTVRFNLQVLQQDPYAPDRNYIGETYNSNQVFSVAAGATIDGINAELLPGGTISGRVTGPEGDGLNMAGVYVYASNASRVSFAWTDENGYYIADRMRTGNYKVRFRATYPYRDTQLGVKWYEDRGSFADGYPVPVQAGSTTSEINAQLEGSGYIEGRVTDSFGDPIQGVSVAAYDAAGILLVSGGTDEDGNYRIWGRLPSGDVVIYFDAINAPGNYASEYNTDKLLIEEADPVSVEAGQTTFGIDAKLVEGGTITGRVTDAQGYGFSGVGVACFDADSERYHAATSDENGNYTLPNLPPDGYYVRFRTGIGTYAMEWYDDKGSSADGEVISVGTGQTISGIDAQLADNGGFVSGRVEDIYGNGIADVYVWVRDIMEGSVYSSVFTDADGYYTAPKIPTCNAKVFFNSDNGYLNYVAEYYNDKSTYETADLVAATLGLETPGINAVLAPISPVSITTTSLPSGEVAVPYSQTLEVTGGREFYYWSVISGNVPPGLTLNSKGELIGTPTATGTHNFTVRVTDSSRNQLIDTQSLSITINAYSGAGFLISGAITFSGSPLPGVMMQGLPGNPVTSPNGEYIIAVPQSWSGTVTPTLSGYYFDPTTRDYTDVDSNLPGQDYTAYELTLQITTEWLLNGTEEYPYNQSLSAEGGTEPYTWTLSSGSLPYGLTLNSNGTISGTPTQPDNYDFTVRVTDSSLPVSQYVERELSINVYGDPTSEAPILYWKLDEGDGTFALDSSGHNDNGALNGNVSHTADAFDGNAAEILANGWIDRTHEASFHFVNQATIMARVKIDDYDQQNRFVWKLQYDEPYRGHPYSLEIALDINGSTLHLDSGNGLIQDIFNCPHYQIDVELTSTGFSLGQYNQIAVTINGDVYKVFINGIEVGSATGAPFEVHDSMQNFWVGGADWSEYWLGGKVDEIMVFNMAYEPQDVLEIYAMGVLPAISGTVLLNDGSPLPWVRMNGLAGDPQVQEDGTYIGVVSPNWTGTVIPDMGGYFFDPPNRSYNDVTSDITAQDYTAYGQGSLWIQTNSLPNGKKGDPYSTTLVAADGTPSYTWSVAPGSLPAGLTLNPNGDITGTPTEAGDFSFTVRVLDSDIPPRAAEQYLSLFVSAAHQGFWSTTYPGGGEIYREGLAIDPNPGSPDRIFATAGGRGIFRSENGGANWINLNDDPNWPYGESDYPIFWAHPGLGNFYMSTWGYLYMSSDGGDSWQPIYYRDNWDMISFAVDPFGSDVIYAGTDKEGIFKTSDGGQNWAARSNGLPSDEISDEIRVIAIDPNDLSSVYVGTRNNGIFKTTNGGGSWAAVNNGIDFQWISDIVIRDDSYVYVAGRDSVNGEGIFRSTNGGGSWTKLPMKAGVDGNPGNYIAIDPSNTDIIYFASYQSVLKSIDGGDSWADSSTSSSPNTLLHLHFDGDLTGADGEVPTQASGVTFEDGVFGSGAYFSVGNQVFYQSVDNIDSAEGTLEFWIKPRWNGNDGQNHVLLQFGGEGGMVFTKDGANNLRSILNLFGGGGNPEVGAIVNVEDWIAHEWHHCAFTWANDSVKLYIDGMLRAEESVTFPLPIVTAPAFQMGANGTYDYLDAVIDELRISSIERSPQDIADSYMAGTMKNLNITSIVIDRLNPQTVYIGTQGEGVFKSDNGGVSWTRVSNGINALHFVGDSPHGLEIDKSDPDYIYAGSINGGYRSINGGSSWEKMDHPSGSILSILTHPAAPGVVYSYHNSLDISTSNGSSGSWEMAAGFPHNFARGDIGIAADNPNLIYVGTWGSNGPPEEPSNGVYKTTDRGLSFTLMNDGLSPTNAEIQTVTVNPGNHDIAFIGLRRDWPYDPAKDYGVYKTIDGGTNWNKITCGLPDDFFTRQIVFCPSDYNVMYMLGETVYECGVYKSVDGGDCWSQISGLCGNSIAVDPVDPDLVYMGAWNDFFVSLDGGISWMEFHDDLPRNPGIDAVALDPNDSHHVFIGTAAGVYEATFSFDFMIVTENLPEGVVGEVYNAALETTGESGSVTWEMISGDLPQGVTFNAGAFSGTPLETGYWDINIRATDGGSGSSYTKHYGLYVYNKYALTVSENPDLGGDVAVDPVQDWYIEGSMVDVSVTPAGGYTFVGWSGDASGRATIVHVEMTRDKTLTANFALTGTLPDYEVSSVDAPVSASAGDKIVASFNAEAHNQGVSDTFNGDISVGIYLSTDVVITTSDILLWKGRSSISALGGGGTVSVPIDADLQIPTTVSTGTYQIGVLVDEFDVIAEQNEDNNYATETITITSSAYDHLEFLGMWRGGESNAVACDEARNLAFIGHGALLQVLDVSDPSHPTKIGELALGTRGISDIKISGNTAYVAGDGFRIIDVSSPTSPAEIGHNDSPYLARGVVVSGNYAYVTDHFHQGLRVFDISDPSNPNQVSFTPFPGRTRGIARSGNYLFLQAGVWLNEGEEGIRIVDITNPSSPSQVNFYATEGSTGWPEIAGNYLLLPTGSEGLHILNITNPLSLPDAIVYNGLGSSGWIKTNGNYAYANDNDRNAIVVLNISDVNNVHEEGAHYFEDQTSINYLDVLGNHCYADGWYHSLKILDMSNPSNPTKIGSYDEFEGLLRDVDVSEDFAFMTTLNEKGVSRFRTLDISNLPEVTEVGIFYNPSDMFRVKVSGNFAFVVTGNRELKVLDISDPSHPNEVAVYDNFDNIYDLEVSGNYAYVLDYFRGLQVIDVSSPANPVFVSQWYTNPRSYRLAISGNYAYVSALWAGVRIIDISDPMNPWEVGFYQNQDLRAYELEASGNYVYVEDVDYNMRIIDVSDPQNPVEVGKFVTEVADISDIEVSGHVVFAGSYIKGMIVIDVSDPYNPVQLDEFPTFYTRAIAIRENRIYELDRGAGLIVYEYRRQ